MLGKKGKIQNDKYGSHFDLLPTKQSSSEKGQHPSECLQKRSAQNPFLCACLAAEFQEQFNLRQQRQDLVSAPWP